MTLGSSHLIVPTLQMGNLGTEVTVAGLGHTARTQTYIFLASELEVSAVALYSGPLNNTGLHSAGSPICRFLKNKYNIIL